MCREKCLNEVDIELVVTLYSALHFAQITLLRLRSPHVHLIRRRRFCPFYCDLKELSSGGLATLITTFFIKVEIKSAASKVLTDARNENT